MTINRFVKTGEYRDSRGEWDGDDGYDEEVEIDDERVLDTLCEWIYADYFKGCPDTVTAIKKLVQECELEDVLMERWWDELKENY